MFRVLIADDENSVVQSLIYSVQWEELELVVAGIASDGTTALKMAQKEKIDIAILDIRMPGINGLELCERLKQMNERIQLIIASGYAEFAYAEKAIQYGVLGYCLKPLDYMQVTRFLRKAVQNLQKGQHMTGQSDLMEILERQEEAEIRECLQNYGISQKKCYLAVSTGEKKLQELENCGISLRLGRGKWGYIMRSNGVEELHARNIQAGGWLGIGYMQQAVDRSKIYGAFEECIARSFQYFIDPGSRICAWSDEDRARQWLCPVHEGLKNREWERVCDILGEIERRGKGDFTARSALRLGNLILANSVSPDDENDSYIYSVEQLVNTYGNFTEMLKQLQQFLKENRVRSEEPQAFTNATFMKLIKYINDNYKGEISLTGAAQALHMNANYVSQLFKKEAGVTFIHYINQKRLEDAKELLVTTQRPLTDIALDVGFNDTFHFIKTFKKFSGMTPGQYRANN